MFGIVGAGQSVSADTLTHSVEVRGIEDNSLMYVRRSFNEKSLLKEKKSEPIVSVAKLRGLVKSDYELLTTILRAEGFYGAQVTRQVARRENHFVIELHVVPGVQYVFGEINYNLEGSNSDAALVEELYNAIALKSNEPAVAARVVAAETSLVNMLLEMGFPFAGQVSKEIVVDHKRQAMDINFNVNSGVRRSIGSLQFQGLKSVSEEYLQGFAEWQQEDRFAQTKINNLRARLIHSNLFSTVTVKAQAAEANRADVLVNVEESKHRTLGISGGYSSAEGFGGEASWEHRNIFGEGERLTLTGRGSEVEQSFSGILEVPNYKRLDQTVTFESLFKREDTDAFFAHTIKVRANLERVLSPSLSVSAGTEFEFSDVTDISGDRDFYITSLPLGVRWDTSDDLLDPSRGFRLYLTTAPSFSIDGNKFAFLKNQIRTSAYFPLARDRKFIVALRSRIGSIIGPGTESLSATRRFFAGGGGSIRGFSFQRVGPLDINDDPLGGRSVAEVAAELRWKITQDVSLVPFLEGGNVYASELPKFTDFRWGAGLGVRYHTNFGPIRFDLAVPLGRQEGERRFQLYISLGQAF